MLIPFKKETRKQEISKIVDFLQKVGKLDFVSILVVSVLHDAGSETVTLFYVT